MMWKYITWAIAITTLVACSLLVYHELVLRDFVHPNYCAMTYMWPSYFRLPVPSRLGYKYRLYLYKDSYRGPPLTTEESIMKMATGIPVLFIPGNAGAYKQVRSLGAVSSRASRFLFLEGTHILPAKEREIERQQIQLNTLDFFVVDFDDELSAFSGAVLQAQTEFVRDCIDYILNSYKQRLKSDAPRTVVLVGHSMGGVISRALFTLPGFDRSKVNTIITLSSPHLYPVVDADYTLNLFYKEVNKYWRNNAADLQHVALVSICGGYRDFQVHTDLCNVSSFAVQSISTISTNIPHVWLSTDHAACVWCNQFVVRLSSALFRLIDPATKQVSSDIDIRMKALRSVFDRYGAPVANSSNLKNLIDADEFSFPSTTANITKFLELPLASQNFFIFRNTTTQTGWRWKLSDWTQHSHLQLLSTTDMEAVTVIGCNDDKCFDLVAESAVPLPFKVRYDEDARMKDFSRILQPGFALNVPITKFKDLFIKVKVTHNKLMESLFVAQLTSGKSSYPVIISSQAATFAEPHPLIQIFELEGIQAPLSASVSISSSGGWTPIIAQLTSKINEQRWGFGELMLKSTTSVKTNESYRLIVILHPQQPFTIEVKTNWIDSLESFLLVHHASIIALITILCFDIQSCCNSSETPKLQILLGLAKCILFSLFMQWPSPPFYVTLLVCTFSIGLTMLLFYVLKAVSFLLRNTTKIMRIRPLIYVSYILLVLSLACHSSVTMLLALLAFLIQEMHNNWFVATAQQLFIVNGLAFGGFVIWLKELNLQWPMWDAYKPCAISLVLSILMYHLQANTQMNLLTLSKIISNITSVVALVVFAKFGTSFGVMTVFINIAVIVLASLFMREKKVKSH